MNEKLSLYTLSPAHVKQDHFTPSQLVTYHEKNHKLQWCYLKPKDIPCFNFELMKEIHQFYEDLHKKTDSQKTQEIRYQVLASSTPGIFSLGGDLRMYKELVQSCDFGSLTQYAHTCIEAMYARATLHQKGITEITLVQGDALGGGFESAIAGDVLIAERGTKFGFPDVLFNSFPGIGAYTFLSRKVNSSIAERLILSGRLYSAEELYEMGVVDILADNGKGEMAVYSYITKANRCENTIDSLRKIRNLHSPLKYDQLLEVATLWAENAMRLTAKDLRMIDRLISKQTIVSSNAA